MKVGIFINTTKSEANKAASAFGTALFENGIDYKIVNLKEDCKGVDVIAVFGGDGTILRVVDYALEFGIPILAVNIGTVGFLSCLESSELNEAIELIKNEIEKLKEEITERELNKAKKKLKSQFASEAETVSEIGESIGYYMTVCDDLDLAEEYIKKLEKKRDDREER